MNSHKSRNTAESLNSIQLSTKNNKKVQPAAKLIYGYDVVEAKVTINCSPLRSEIFSPSPSCVVSKVHNITSYI